MTGNRAGITPRPVTAAASPAEGSEVAPPGAGEASQKQCTRCGAVGTHFLTCPALRLPSGYRLGDASAPGRPLGEPASRTAPGTGTTIQAELLGLAAR